MKLGWFTMAGIVSSKLAARCDTSLDCIGAATPRGACVQNQCVFESACVGIENACPTDQFCNINLNRCETKSNSCKGIPCPVGTICNTNNLTCDLTDDYCSSNSDCFRNQYCKDNTCRNLKVKASVNQANVTTTTQPTPTSVFAPSPSGISSDGTGNTTAIIVILVAVFLVMLGIFLHHVLKADVVQQKDPKERPSPKYIGQPPTVGQNTNYSSPFAQNHGNQMNLASANPLQNTIPQPPIQNNVPNRNSSQPMNSSQPTNTVPMNTFPQAYHNNNMNTGLHYTAGAAQTTSTTQLPFAGSNSQQYSTTASSPLVQQPLQELDLSAKDIQEMTNFLSAANVINVQDQPSNQMSESELPELILQLSNQTRANRQSNSTPLYIPVVFSKPNTNN